MECSVKKAYKRKIKLYAILAWSFLALFMIMVVVVFFNISSINKVHPIVMVISAITFVLIVFSSFVFNLISFHTHNKLMNYKREIQMKRNKHHFRHILRLLEENKFDDAVVLFKSNVSLNKRDSSYIDGYIKAYMAHAINKMLFKYKSTI